MNAIDTRAQQQDRAARRSGDDFHDWSRLDDQRSFDDESRLDDDHGIMARLRARRDLAARDRERTETRLRGAMIGVLTLTVGASVLLIAGNAFGGAAEPSSRPQTSAAAPLSTTTPAAGSTANPQTTPQATPQWTDRSATTAMATTVATTTTPGAALEASTRGPAQTPATPRAGAASAQATQPAAGASAVPNSLNRGREAAREDTPGTSSAAAPRAAATPRSTPLPRSSSQPGRTVAPTPAASTRGSSRTHSVRAGDTLFAIALRYDTTVDALVQVNQLKTPDELLSIGQKLVLP
ncbi:MAG: LysM peptidoglycan-binding domain-containing protein [Chloroflexota bacterium]